MYHLISSSTNLYWPSTSQYRHILTQYHQVPLRIHHLMSHAQYTWSSSPTQESSFQLLLGFILYSQGDLVWPGSGVQLFTGGIDHCAHNNHVVIDKDEWVHPTKVSWERVWIYMFWIYFIHSLDFWQVQHKHLNFFIILDFFIPVSTPDRNGIKLKNWTNLQNKTGPQTDCLIQLNFTQLWQKSALWLTKKICKWHDFAWNPKFLSFPWTARTKRSHGRYSCSKLYSWLVTPYLLFKVFR